MNVYKIKIIFISCLSIFSLISCSETNPTRKCLDDEVVVDGFCISSDLIELSTDINAVYIFDKEDDIVEEDVIDNIEVIVDYLIIRGITEDKEITYNISLDNDNYLDNYNNIVYLNVDHINSFEAVFHSILSLYDTKVNYGLLYGLSNYIAIELDFIEQDTESLNADTLNYFLNEDKQDLMDLTYPTFTETYASGDDIEHVKSLSIQLVSFIINENNIYDLIDLLALSEHDEFEHQYNTYLNAWILDSGYDYEVPINDYSIFFDRSLGSYYSIWYTEHATWYLHENYRKKEWISFLPENFLMNDYKELKGNIILFEEEMSRIDNLLKSDEINYIPLRIHIGPAPVSRYNSGFMQLALIPALSHEYVHYITYPYMTNSQWILEAVAAYYSYDFYYMDKYIEETYFGSNDFGDFSLKVNKAVEEFENIYNREINYLEDKYEWVDVYVYLEEQYDDVYGVYNNDSIFQYISFVNYMIKTYNNESFITVCEDSSRLDELTGKTWPEHISDWEQYIKAKYK